MVNKFQALNDEKIAISLSNNMFKFYVQIGGINGVHT